MTAHASARQFTAALGVREHVPLLIGLMGPSGGGKTFSALRLATGIQKVSGGDIYVIDTEARRALHYADQFQFKHVPFDAPFGSLDYLEALRFAVKKGAGVVIVDSMSHEHEGPGGLLDFHEAELTRMAGDNYNKREAMKMLAWGKPKAARRALINGLLQMNANFIFCFRAKNSVKPVKVNGKTEVVPQGFMPIAGDEFVFEMTLNALLLPGANGVPTWEPEHVGERLMSKLPSQFRQLGLVERPSALDERLGERLALWARGGEAPATTRTKAAKPAPLREVEPEEAGDPPPHDAGERTVPAGFKTGAALRDEQEQALTDWASDLAAEVPDMDANAIEALLSDSEAVTRFGRLSEIAPDRANALNNIIDRRQQELRR